MSARVQRVADQIQRELASLIQMEVNDPRVGMVSVTDVEVSRDLAHAKIYVTVLNTMTDDSQVNESTLSEPGDLDKLEIEENINALNKAAGYLRSLLAKRLSTRSVPKLRFYYDGSIERGQQLSSLIDSALAADQDSHS
ncbi:MAG TPA: 30S ribosome-binding factor RbfA [Gammaproteobacteria bacterium]|jgi:ribosome-binding factor A|nr:30S ribosome-binding factor RbfA [Pseudomonadales bacterium]MBT6480423.1 30S ribosome-binding factor RbfA [Gammaproteobacteria bacterium]MBT7226927.1 30S ribosome-binding factor RbfA [Gammaproteobacteria bacterium]HAS48563.1 30S ribosome-binding factor RbfA [Gammaproteobacteria bacterium]